MRLPLSAASAVFALVALPAEAQLSLPPAAAFCANCHGTDGRLTGPIPALAGRPADVLLAKLAEFKQDKAAQATVMPRLVKGLTDAELEAAAQYFSKLR
jgi:sulfide dehydrogenase cytochrome subunit